MNTQEMFDTVVKHLLSQKKRSMGRFASQAEELDLMDDSMCAYRGENGLKCAIGCLIPDDLYDPKMEGQVVGALFAFPGIGKYIINTYIARGLQSIHDACEPENWEDALRRFAKTEGLIFPEL